MPGNVRVDDVNSHGWARGVESPGLQWKSADLRGDARAGDAGKHFERAEGLRRVSMNVG